MTHLVVLVGNSSHDARAGVACLFEHTPKNEKLEDACPSGVIIDALVYADGS